MKRILSLVVALFTVTSALFSQGVSWSMRPSGENKVKIYVRNDATARAGLVSQTLITVTVPQTLSPRPTATIASLGGFSYINHTPNDVYEMTVDGTAFAVYNWFSATAGNNTTTLDANTEYEVAEITFSGGNVTTQVRLSGLPNGGTNSLSTLVMEIGGAILTNATSMVYGPGAVNSPQGFAGYSFLPLEFALPVNFLSFYAIKNGDDAKLNWTVENDENNNFFSLERSSDGRNFKPFGQLPAMSNGRNSNTYESLDQALTKHGSRNLYYRIKQVDKSGIATYSDIRIVDVEGATQSVNLFPNPAKSFTKVVIDAPQAMRATINLRDQSGKQVQVIPVQLQKGVNQQDINVSALPSGEYNLNVNGVGFNPKAVKLIKIN